MQIQRPMRSLLLTLLGYGFAACAVGGDAVTKTYEIRPQSLSTALKAFAAQSDMQLIFTESDVAQAETAGVNGSLSPRDALAKMLEGTHLQFEFTANNVIVVRKAQPLSSRASSDDVLRLAQGEPQQNEPSSSGAEPLEELDVSAIPEILVTGSKILNMDVRRSRDDAQPYVIFDRTSLLSSGANTVEDFLKNRLTMNTQASSFSQSPTVLGSGSQVNLRGLGTNQTLILIDGHRTAAPSVNASPFQPDLNTIPLAAIERIEVLPTTASGIYGGSATGGVVNIVLRRDYSGAQARVVYDNSFDSDAANRKIDLTGGFSLEDGRTQVLLAASYADANLLAARERDFHERGHAAILAHNPGFFLQGSPPLGATTNIRSADGSPLFGPGTPSFTSVPDGYAGGGGLAPLEVNAGAFNLQLADSAQEGGGRKALVNSPVIRSVTGTIRRRFAPSVEGFIEFNAADNRGRFINSAASTTYTVSALATNNPFGRDLLVTVPSADADTVSETANDTRRLVGGVIVKLPAQWSAEADFTWNRARHSDFAANQGYTGAEAAGIFDGSIDVLRDTRAFPLDFSGSLAPPSFSEPVDSTLRDATLRLAGPLPSIWGRAINVSGLIEHRSEKIDDAFYSTFGLRILSPSRSQEVDSIYLETKIPLLRPSSRPWARSLELQVAGRYDDYRIEGANLNIFVGSGTPVVRSVNESHSANPTLGLRYQPAEDVMLRASYGTGFLPPSVTQLTTDIFDFPVPGLANDPRRNGEPTDPVRFFFVGNPNLTPEKSRSWSAGLVLTPHGLAGLRASIDYTRIDKTDNITFLSAQEIVDNESLLPERVVRAAPEPGDPFGVGKILSIDATPLNIAEARADSYDVQLDYHLDTARAGGFDFFALATWQTHYLTQLIPTAPVVENVGITSEFPLKLKANGGMKWTRGPLTLGWTAQYFDSYRLRNPTQILNQGAGGVVPSQTYHDVFGTYRFSSLLAGTEVQAGVKNIFDERPPLDMANTANGFYSPFGDVRLATYYVALKQDF